MIGEIIKGCFMDWGLRDAENHFAELLNNALLGEPQVVHRSQEAVVIISKQEYERLTHQYSFKEHLLNAPVGIEDVFVARDKSPHTNT
jgi:prevent-host-death family protein